MHTHTFKTVVSAGLAFIGALLITVSIIAALHAG